MFHFNRIGGFQKPWIKNEPQIKLTDASNKNWTVTMSNTSMEMYIKTEIKNTYWKLT